MKYKCGMYSGSFSPLHQGHVRCIIEATNQCETLIIAISQGKHKEEIDIHIRYGWIDELTRHMGNVKIFIVGNDAKKEEACTEENWCRDADEIKEFAGEKIDVVFCGSDYSPNSWWNQCHPNTKLEIIERDELSSTKIRQDIYGNWDGIPNIVKPYYVKRVLLTGGESTSRSTLAINLTNYYNTDRILFQDTDSLTTDVALPTEVVDLNSYDLILSLEPDPDFVQVKEISKQHSLNVEVISGDHQQRFEKAVSLINTLLE